MATNKLIEQVLDLCYKSLQWESGEISGWDQIQLELKLQKLFESKAREVALAICPELEKEIEKQKELYLGLKELGDERISKLEKDIEKLKKDKLIHQMFIGKVSDVIGVGSAMYLLNESKKAFNH